MFLNWCVFCVPLSVCLFIYCFPATELLHNYVQFIRSRPCCFLIYCFISEFAFFFYSVHVQCTCRCTMCVSFSFKFFAAAQVFRTVSNYLWVRAWSTWKLWGREAQIAQSMENVSDRLLLVSGAINSRFVGFIMAVRKVRSDIFCYWSVKKGPHHSKTESPDSWHSFLFLALDYYVFWITIYQSVPLFAPTKG